MSGKVFKALLVVLEEFGNVDLCPRLDYFAGEDEEGQEMGRQLEAAWVIVESWVNAQNADDDGNVEVGPVLSPEDELVS
jgi:hypothetical protein